MNGKELCVFTRRMAALIEAGMPLQRELRIWGEQERNPSLMRVIRAIGAVVENGDSLSEAVAHCQK